MAYPVKKVFLSSTLKGLQQFRDAATEAINGTSGYKCIRMEDFAASPEPPIELCLRELADCDIYLGLIGHNYGSYVRDTGRSYTETEYDAAMERGMPALMFMASQDFPVAASDIDDDVRRDKQKAFRDRLSALHTRATFDNPFDVSISVTRALQNIRSPQEPVIDAVNSTTLLFPLVTNAVGFDTGVSISNTSARPKGTSSKDGVCTLYYYGATDSGLTPTKQVSQSVKAGQQLSFVASSGGTHGILGTPGFHGYVLAECDFPNARGFAMVFDGPVGQARVASGYTAEVVPSD